MSSVILLKENFKPSKRIENFYDGGSIAMSADGQFLLCEGGSGAEDMEGSDVTLGGARLVNMETGAIVSSLSGDSQAITSLLLRDTAAGPAAEAILASRSLQIRIVDTASGRVVRSFKAHDVPAVTMILDRSNSLLATGFSDGTVRVWDLERGFITHHFRAHRGPVTSLLFVREGSAATSRSVAQAASLKGDLKSGELDGWVLASGGDDGVICLWDLESRALVSSLQSHVSAVSALSVAADGSRLLSASRDKVVCLWDVSLALAEGRARSAGSRAPADVPVGCAADLPSGHILFFTAGDRGTVRVWNANTGACIGESSKDSPNQAFHCAFLSADKRHVIGVTIDRTLLFYSLESPTLARSRQLVGSNDAVIDLAYGGPEEELIVRVYNTRTNNTSLLFGHSDVVLALACHRAGGDLLLTGSKDKTARLWELNAETGEFAPRATLVGHTDAITAVAFGRRSRGFALTASEDRTVKCWDIASGASTAAARYTVIAHAKDINTLAVAPNDRLFATGSQDKQIKVWETETGALSTVFTGHKRGIWSVDFSPTERVLASASGDKTIRIWSLEDGSCLKTLEGHTNSVLRVCFLSAGLQVASAGSDGLVKLWTLRTSECVATMDGHEDRVWALASATEEDGCQLVSGGADAVIQVWDDSTESERQSRREAEEQALMCEQELSNYLHVKDYPKAVNLCIRLGQPRRLYTILSDLANGAAIAGAEDPKQAEADRLSITGSAAIDRLFQSYRGERLAKLISYVREWNTQARFSLIAQRVLNLILRAHSPRFFLDKTKGYHGLSQDTIDALLAYSERHVSRIDRLLTRSFLVDFSLDSMGVYIAENPLPEVTEEEPEADAAAPGAALDRLLDAADSDEEYAGDVPLIAPSLEVDSDDGASSSDDDGEVVFNDGTGVKRQASTSSKTQRPGPGGKRGRPAADKDARKRRSVMA
ncbi:hypothetical protein H696_01109 [Fonticula alba]|uniref:U3 small nucleolar RNA-associated protein 13 C-terminal domain-containing protein n=1 Tax=Fonticula alba TaxID=691883 RepID=A0A058ZB83_FONAL|nr:hypothetical protein H696_01109 [Fonticula alba]KCV71685.1 hypothetical protein H696_01109 [Fonticula alba]|eukprot:XP_009493263.1 hypothetical protein H696_01109 [Fonticula alba]